MLVVSTPRAIEVEAPLVIYITYSLLYSGETNTSVIVPISRIEEYTLKSTEVVVVAVAVAAASCTKYY
jgi:hypothetical protein